MLLRDFDLSHANQLQDLNTRFRGLSDKWMEHQDREDEILLEISNSGSSILAWSMSHDARLRDVQSLYSQMSDKLEHIVETISSQSSRSSSQLGEGNAQSISFRAELSVIKSREFDSALSETVEADLEDCYSDGEEFIWDEESLEHDERDEVRRLLDLHKDFRMVARQYFDPIVAEYVVKAQ
jgi:hypothetical protein